MKKLPDIQLSASDFNSFKNDIQNYITDNKLTVDITNYNQFWGTLASDVPVYDIYCKSSIIFNGVAHLDSYSLLSSYYNGLKILFELSSNLKNDNTFKININNLGDKLLLNTYPIKPVKADELKDATGRLAIAYYDADIDAFILMTQLLVGSVFRDIAPAAPFFTVISGELQFPSSNILQLTYPGPQPANTGYDSTYKQVALAAGQKIIGRTTSINNGSISPVGKYTTGEGDRLVFTLQVIENNIIRQYPLVHCPLALSFNNITNYTSAQFSTGMPWIILVSVMPTDLVDKFTAFNQEFAKSNIILYMVNFPYSQYV